jgi:hypothetical protein
MQDTLNSAHEKDKDRVKSIKEPWVDLVVKT